MLFFFFGRKCANHHVTQDCKMKEQVIAFSRGTYRFTATGTAERMTTTAIDRMAQSHCSGLKSFSTHIMLFSIVPIFSFFNLGR
mmetsp:Transcript_28069/g.41350  ORF Transcript_28069/g.41350 Transcript_28069/m.41350 type:complete len:84 (-) Transcript_28069:16-267(-)